MRANAWPRISSMIRMAMPLAVTRSRANEIVLKPIVAVYIIATIAPNKIVMAIIVSTIVNPRSSLRRE